MLNDTDFGNQIVCRQGWTQNQLKAAFERVQNPRHWKLGNETAIPESDFEITNEATIFFAGSPCRIIHRYGVAGHVLIKFDGYYACVGA